MLIKKIGFICFSLIVMLMFVFLVRLALTQSARTDKIVPMLDIWNNIYDSIQNSLIIHVSGSNYYTNIEKHFFVGGYSTLNENDSLIFCFTTPDSSVAAHMIFCINSMSIMKAIIYEGGTYSGGTSAISYNSDRNSDNESALTVKYNPQSYEFGTGIDSSKTGVSMGGTKTTVKCGSIIESKNKMILRINQTYMWVVVSEADDNYITYHWDWDEVN